MDLLSLEVIVVSAKALNKLAHSSKMKTYVVVTLTGGALSDQKFQTNVDTKGGENPTWNFPMKFIVGRHAANSLLSFTLMSETAVVGDEFIGHVKLPVAELMKFVEDGNSMQYVSCPVMETSGHTTRGELNFSYKFGASRDKGVAIGVAPFDIETVVLPDHIESADVFDASVIASAGDFDASIIEFADVSDALVIESTDISDDAVIESADVFDASIIESTDVVIESAGDSSDAS